jgi:quinol monooxygenase YgiN
MICLSIWSEIMSANSGTFVVIAEFSVAKEHRAEFLLACAEDATSSVRDEPACRAFDVLTSSDSDELIVLHEIYDDQPAFEAHRETPHFAAFVEAIERFGVTRTQLRFFNQL